MKVAIGSDHGGYDLKTFVAGYLKEQGYEVTDHGCYDKESVDYPDYAKAVAHDVKDKKTDCGVLICTSGQGMSMTANKVQGIRAALCTDEYAARMSRLHNDANILVMGANPVDEKNARVIMDVWFATEFEGGRHQRRVQKIDNSEN
ncbi:MAG: ribose 5-phosphate isomerase B [Candidatus Ancaeobacter aquaticus]|nr:ribose 5-phosphate isomerase B [Candidatus Ancaeobacter aquaticus]